MTIYVIIGETGECADRYKWISKCFTDEQIALDYELKCQKFADSVEPTDYKAIQAATKLSPDPHFNMDYTGTTYYIQSHELVTDKFMESILKDRQ